MPQRMVDGNAWALSRKIKDGVEERYRLHYILWLTLAEANGTFEVDIERIHAVLYAFQMPGIKTRNVKEMLTQFTAAGVLHVWKAPTRTGSTEKTWGWFPGSEKPGRLVSKEHLKRYKDLPPDYPGPIPDASGNMPRGFGVGVGKEGFGVGLEPPTSAANQNQNQPRLFSETPEGNWLKTLGGKQLEEIVAKAKRFTKQLIGEWQAIHGPAAILNYPDRDRDAWEWLCENVDNSILLEAFRKWARTARRTDKWALGEFSRRYEEFTDKIVVPEDPQVLATRQHSEDLDLKFRQERAASILNAPPKAAEPGGFEDYLAELDTTELN